MNFNQIARWTKKRNYEQGIFHTDIPIRPISIELFGASSAGKATFLSCKRKYHLKDIGEASKIALSIRFLKQRIALLNDKILSDVSYSLPKFSTLLDELQQKSSASYANRLKRINLDLPALELYDRIHHFIQREERSNRDISGIELKGPRLWPAFCPHISSVLRSNATYNPISLCEQLISNYREILQRINKALKCLQRYFTAQDKFAILMSKLYCIKFSDQQVHLRCIRSDPNTGESDCLIAA